MKFNGVWKLILIMCLPYGLMGCEQNPFALISSLQKDIEAQNIRIMKLENQASDTGTKLNNTEARLSEAVGKLFLLELSKDPFKTATFDPAADKGFQRIDTSVGSLAVAIRGITPYADGIKIRLDVGNLTSAVISGGTFTAKWGPRMPKTNNTDSFKKYMEWKEKLVEKESKFTEELRPGTWNNLNLTLPGLPPEQFGYLELSLDTNNIKMSVAR